MKTDRISPLPLTSTNHCGPTPSEMKRVLMGKLAEFKLEDLRGGKVVGVRVYEIGPRRRLD